MVLIVFRGNSLLTFDQKIREMYLKAKVEIPSMINRRKVL